MKTSTTLSLLIIVLAVGNRSFAQGTSPEHFSEPIALMHFVLENDLTLTTEVKSIFGRVTQLHPILSKGDYLSVFADAEGTYYQGPKGCLPNPNKNALFKALDGGLWIPKDDSKQKPTLWFYLQAMPDSLGKDAGPIIRYLDSLSAGNVKKDTGEIVDFSFMANLRLLPYAKPAERESGSRIQ